MLPQAGAQLPTLERSATENKKWPKVEAGSQHH
jgi:hypothetical protein